MLYGLYGGTFFCNVLFYMKLLRGLPEENVMAFNTLYMFLCTAGVLSYGFLHEKWGAGVRAGVLYGALVLCCGGSLGLWLGGLPPLLAVPLFALPYGYVSGHIAYLASCLVPLARQGRFIGAGLGLCNLALYFALYLPEPYQLLLVLGALAAAAGIIRHQGEVLPAGEEKTKWQGEVLGRHLPLTVLIAAALGLLVGFDDGIFFPRLEEYGLTFATSRLFMAAGYFLAGWAADFLPLYLPVIALVAKGVPVFVRAGSDDFALALLSYTDAFFTGALIILVIRLFFWAAPFTSRPRLWAGMGRGLELPMSAMGALFGVAYLEQQELSLIVACHGALLLICALLFYRAMLIYADLKEAVSAAEPLNFSFSDGINYLTGLESVPKLHDLPLRPPATQEELMEDLRRAYSFTEREMEVLGSVLVEDAISDIAASLCVSERTVKFHISNLLKKTGCKNQNELRDKIKRIGM